MRKWGNFTVSMAIGWCISYGEKEIPLWFLLKSQQGATLEQVKSAFETEQLAKQTVNAANSKFIDLSDPEMYEMEKGFHFNRWMEYAEPRVADHDGDLSVLGQTQSERLKLSGILGNVVQQNGNWENLGPYAQNTGGAGRINWLEFHPTDPNTLMVGSPGGGVWISEDNGETWGAMSDNIGASLGAAWGVYDPTNPSIIYLGTGDGPHSDTRSIGLLKSTDGGQTWNTTGLTFDISNRTQIHKLAISSDASVLFVAASNGLHRSTDGGESFDEVEGDEFWDVEFKPGEENIVYASSDADFYRSTNGGQTFTQVSGISGGGNRVHIEVSPAVPNNVYVLTTTSSDFTNLYISTNSGQTFPTRRDPGDAACSQSWYSVAYGVSPVDPNDMAFGCLRNYLSDDAGASMDDVTGSHVDIHALVWNKDGDLYSLNDGGIYFYSNGGSRFNSRNNNLSISQGYRIGVYKNDYDRICTGRQDNGTDIHHTRNTGFERANGADGMECFFSLDGQTVYMESQNGGFERCDYVDNDTESCTGVDNGLPSGIWNTPWGQHPTENNTIFAGRGSDFFRSTNRGSNWTELGSVSSSIRNFTVAPSDPDVIYVMAGSNVYRSSNGGQSFSDVWPSQGTPYYAAVNENDPDDVWVVVSSYTSTSKVYHSTNGGEDWTNETADGLPNVPAISIALDNNNGSNGTGVYVGTDVGVYYRDNRFEEWQNFSKKLALSSVREIEIAQKGNNANDRRIVASTYGRGVWISPLWDESIAVGVDKIALLNLRHFSAKVDLASGKLHLHYQMGRDKNIGGSSVMEIADVKGKRLYSESVPNFGVYDKKLDITKWNKGVYFVMFKNGSEKIQKRVALF